MPKLISRNSGTVLDRQAPALVDDLGASPGPGQVGRVNSGQFDILEMVGQELALADARGTQVNVIMAVVNVGVAVRDLAVPDQVEAGGGEQSLGSHSSQSHQSCRRSMLLGTTTTPPSLMGKRRASASRSYPMVNPGGILTPSSIIARRTRARAPI